ncbi:hypothetical protein EE612_033413, partial [Oryza sativa]
QHHDHQRRHERRRVEVVERLVPHRQRCHEAPDRRPCGRRPCRPPAKTLREGSGRPGTSPTPPPSRA